MFFRTNKPIVCVHSGKFHPDDVSAVAILSLALGKPLSIIRSRDPKDWAKADYVFDVGGVYDAANNRFDHHQETFSEKRDNGIMYSSAGLAWKHFGEKIAGTQAVWQKIDKKIIEPLDAEDNGTEIVKPVFEGVAPFMYSDFISDMNLTYFEKEESSLLAFERAVEETKKMLLREVKKSKDTVAMEKIVEEIYQKSPDKRLIVLPDNYTWQKTLEKYSEPLFVVKPEPESKTWHAYTVRASDGKFKNRLDFPESWASKRDQELADITGVPDAIFCHRGRFIAVAKSKAGAIKLAELALAAGNK